MRSRLQQDTWTNENRQEHVRAVDHRDAKRKADLETDALVRPKVMEAYVGQEVVRDQVQLIIDASKKRGKQADHLLLVGPPGLGKTTLAQIIAHEMEAQIHIASGTTLIRPSDVSALLMSLNEGDVLFIDEVHRLNHRVTEMLYGAMEDFKVDVMGSQDGNRSSVHLEIAPFTLIAATTGLGTLPAPFLDRFGFTAHMDYYTVEELEQVIFRASVIMQVTMDQEAIHELALRSRETPRIALRLLRRVKDYAEVRTDDGLVTKTVLHGCMRVFEIDELGLDRLDRAVLETLIRSFRGGPVGIETLAMTVGEENSTIREGVEPFLVRAGLMVRTPRGRVATPDAWRHVGLGGMRQSSPSTDE